MTIAAGLLYLIAMAAIGAWSLRRTGDTREFFIAGQRLGPLVIGLGTMSAAFSGFVFVGGPGLTYRAGLASLWICLPVGITSGLLCWTVGKRLRLLSEVREVFTLPDALRHRFDSNTVGGFAAIAIIAGTVGYLAAQLLALGIILETVLRLENSGPWSLAIALSIGLAVLIFYSASGGMLAGAYTDFVQGVVMLVTAGTVFAFSVKQIGSWTLLVERITESPHFGPAHLEPFGTLPITAALAFFFVFSVGVIGQPHMVHKFLMLDDPRNLRWLPLIIGGTQAICLLIWIGIGSAVPSLVAAGSIEPLLNPDDAAPLFLRDFCPPAVAGIAFAGVLAAIMSTADSFLNIAAAALVRDLPRACGRPVRNELAWSRAATVAIPVIAVAVAYGYGDLVALLGTFAFGTFAAALAPVLAIGLNWRGATAVGAAASIATGLAANFALETLSRSGSIPALAPGISPAIALSLSTAVLLAVSMTTAPPANGLAEEIDAVMSM